MRKYPLFLFGLLLTIACTTETSPPTPTPLLADRLSGLVSVQTNHPTPTLANTQEPATVAIIPSATSQPATATATMLSSTATVEPSATATASATLVMVTPAIQTAFNAVNLRSGPRTDYPVIGFLMGGESAEVLAVYGEGNGWYNVRLDNGSLGWVGANVVQPLVAFEEELIPTVATIPPTSTPTATATPIPTNTPLPPFATATRLPTTTPNAPTPIPWPTYNPYP